MDPIITPIDFYPEVPSFNTARNDEVTDFTPRYQLPLSDADMYSLIQQKRQAARDFRDSTVKWDERRARNRDYWRGRHYSQDTGMPDEAYYSGYIDPMIYENAETRFKLASQRMPDIIVTAHDDNNLALESANVVEQFLRKKVGNKVTQRMLKNGLRQREINFTAAVKCIWNPNLSSGNGDFTYYLVNPSRLILDPTAIYPDDGYTADNMEFIGEILEEPVEMIYAKFPNKATQLKQMIELSAINGLGRPSKLKYEEWWLRYYKNGQTYEGTVWLYQTLILGQQRNPYYDWEGYKVYKPRVEKDGSYKTTATLDSETRFYNYFEIPRKPYIFLTYQNLGESPYDDTTAIEQAIPTQRLVNRTGRQIVEISANAVPKKVFGNLITKEDARRISNDPDESIWLDAPDVSKAMTWIQANPPAPELFNLLTYAGQRMDGIFNTHGPIKGQEAANDESGIAKQITREGDLTSSDDLVDIVVERVIFEMAGWAMQMAKMFYDEPHFIKLTGESGTIMTRELTKKDFRDGIEVDVKANSVDAATNRADALNMMSRKAIDPLTAFEDMDKPNAKERVRRWIAFMNGANDGYASYLKELGIDLESTSNMQPPFTPGGDQTEAADQAQKDITQMTQGTIIAPPDKFDQTYVAAFVSFIRSGQFQSLPQDIKKNFRDFVQQLSQNFQNFQVNTPGSAFNQGPVVGTPQMAGVPATPPALPGGQ